MHGLTADLDPASDNALAIATTLQALGGSAVRLFQCRNSLDRLQSLLLDEDVSLAEKGMLPTDWERIDDEEAKRAERERIGTEYYFEIGAIATQTSIVEMPLISLDNKPISRKPDARSSEADEKKIKSKVEIPEGLEGLSEEYIENILPSLDLSMEEKALLRRFANAEAVMVLHLQKADGLRQIYERGEWKEFKNAFPHMRDTIVEVLASEGVNVMWREYGRQKGKRYQLTLASNTTIITDMCATEATQSLVVASRVEPEAEDEGSSETQEVIQRPATSSGRALLYYERLQAEQAAEKTARDIDVSGKAPNAVEDLYFKARFSAQLLEGIVEVTETQTEGTISQSELVVIISDNLGITERASRGIISQFAEKSDLQRTKLGNRKFVALDGDKLNALRKGALSKEDSTEEMFTESDLEYAPKIFKQLLALTHVQQGQTFSQLIVGAGVEGEAELEFRRTVRKLISRGYLLLDKNANPNTRSDRSKKLRMPWVKIANQEMKRRLKDDFSGVLNELEASSAVSV